MERVDRLDSVLTVFIRSNGEAILTQARLLAGSRHRGPLYGVPFTVTELTAVEGLPHRQCC